MKYLCHCLHLPQNVSVGCNYLERPIVSSIRKVIALDHTFDIVFNSGFIRPWKIKIYSGWYHSGNFKKKTKTHAPPQRFSFIKYGVHGSWESIYERSPPVIPMYSQAGNLWNRRQQLSWDREYETEEWGRNKAKSQEDDVRNRVNLA